MAGPGQAAPGSLRDAGGEAPLLHGTGGKCCLSVQNRIKQAEKKAGASDCAGPQCAGCGTGKGILRRAGGFRADPLAGAEMAAASLLAGGPV